MEDFDSALSSLGQLMAANAAPLPMPRLNALSLDDSSFGRQFSGNQAKGAYHPQTDVGLLGMTAGGIGADPGEFVARDGTALRAWKRDGTQLFSNPATAAPMAGATSGHEDFDAQLAALSALMRQNALSR